MIYAIGQEVKHPTSILNIHLYYGLFRSTSRSQFGGMKVADAEGYFFDKKRSLGVILPYYLTNLDGAIHHTTNSVKLDCKESTPGIFHISYIVQDSKSGEWVNIWKDIVPESDLLKIKSSLIEFADFFADLSLEFVTQ